MKPRIQFFAFLLAIIYFGLSACECDKMSSGQTMNAADALPLDNVMIEAALLRKGEVLRRDILWTDSLGNFSYEDFFGNGLKRCPDLQLTFSRDSFITQVVLEPGFSLTVWLQPE